MRRMPEPTIRRLIKYYRYLRKLEDLEGRVILSQELGAKTGVNAAQVRKDFSYIGELGQKGVGYEIKKLKVSLEQTLGMNRKCSIIIVGAGNLGRALCTYEELEKLGICISAIFDNDLNKIGTQINELKVRNIKNMEKYIVENNIEIAVLTVPATVALKITDRLIKSGIKDIWNFAPVSLATKDKTRVFSEDLASDLGSLIYYLNNM